MRRSMLALLAVAAALPGCSEKTEKQMNDAFNDGFRNSCIASATKSGAPPSAAATICSCVIDRMDKKYSATEKLRLSDEDAMPIMKECMESMVQKQ